MKHKTNYYALAGVFIFLALVVFGSVAAKKHDTGQGWIGVYTQKIDKDLQEAFDLDNDHGIVVVDVVDDSPAEEAGLRRKDIILKFNDHDITDTDDLADYVADMNVGDKADIGVLRKGQEKTLEVEIGERPRYKWTQFDPDKSLTMPKGITRSFGFSSGGGGYIGVGIQDLSEQLGNYFGVEDGEGVLITEVFEDSPAEKAGLKAGDVIVSVDDEQIADISDLRDMISEKEEGDEVKIGYLRQGDKQVASVEVTEDSFGMQQFSIPNLNIQIPNYSRFKNLDHFFYSDDDNSYFDVKEYRKEMEQLQKEMQKMQQELKELKLKLE